MSEALSGMATHATKHSNQSQTGCWDGGKAQDWICTHLQCRETGGEAFELYINQLVSASLDSPMVGLLVNQTASMYGQNFTTVANITFGDLPGDMV